MADVKLDPQVFAILKEKIQMIQTEEGAIYLVGPIRLPVNLYEETFVFNWYCWLTLDEITTDYESIIKKLNSANLAEYQQSSVLVYGDFKNDAETLVRMHSICHTGDIFGSKRCDCGYQLKQSMKRITDHGSGALFYLANHEGRGIGLFSKAMAYLLQENGYDTVEANEKLGYVDDSRNYGGAIAILKTLRTSPVTLMTNNPKKVEAIEKAGLQIASRTSLWGDESEFNTNYLQTKIERSGHLRDVEEALHVKP
ncbi:GTP cyclohydrolase II [Planococcus versutus]|uniref:GTP cyclohydrolase II n=1 Tax=Planococcus versutus TaxID=1302659 RepID=A0A1B1S095_9BACL|nr:GTP cyclohydrolase II [Planococcus versutus]ANU26638.1 GTP cyclohydrolase [Planococcus versutus]